MEAKRHLPSSHWTSGKLVQLLHSTGLAPAYVCSFQRQGPTVPKQEANTIKFVNRHGQCLGVKKLVLAHTGHTGTST